MQSESAGIDLVSVKWLSSLGFGKYVEGILFLIPKLSQSGFFEKYSTCRHGVIGVKL